jgi:hypothetical protein
MSATYQDAMTPDEYNNTTEEKDLQAAIVAEAKALGWKVHSVWNSQHSPAGWPDLFLVHPQTGRRLALELKTAGGKVSIEQEQWLSALAVCGIPAMVIRPCDRDAVREWLR